MIIPDQYISGRTPRNVKQVLEQVGYLYLNDLWRQRYNKCWNYMKGNSISSEASGYLFLANKSLYICTLPTEIKMNVLFQSRGWWNIWNFIYQGKNVHQMLNKFYLLFWEKQLYFFQVGQVVLKHPGASTAHLHHQDPTGEMYSNNWRKLSAIYL